MCRSCWNAKRDVAFSVGTPMYSFSFSLNRFRKVKPVTLDCGTNTLNHVLETNSHLSSLYGLQTTIENIETCESHPLLQLKPNQLPDVINHKLEIFKLRYEILNIQFEV